MTLVLKKLKKLMLVQSRQCHHTLKFVPTRHKKKSLASENNVVAVVFGTHHKKASNEIMLNFFNHIKSDAYLTFPSIDFDRRDQKGGNEYASLVLDKICENKDVKRIFACCLFDSGFDIYKNFASEVKANNDRVEIIGCYMWHTPSLPISLPYLKDCIQRMDLKEVFRVMFFKFLSIVGGIVTPFQYLEKKENEKWPLMFKYDYNSEKPMKMLIKSKRNQNKHRLVEGSCHHISDHSSESEMKRHSQIYYADLQDFFTTCIRESVEKSGPRIVTLSNAYKNSNKFDQHGTKVRGQQYIQSKTKSAIRSARDTTNQRR